MPRKPAISYYPRITIKCRLRLNADNIVSEEGKCIYLSAVDRLGMCIGLYLKNYPNMTLVEIVLVLLKSVDDEHLMSK